MLVRITAVVGTALAMAARHVHAGVTATDPSGDAGKLVALYDQNNFCLMLPSQPNQSIGEAEGSSKAWCLPGAAATPGSTTLPSSAIKSAHVVLTDQYIQVTGVLDSQQLQLLAGDDGGMYDNAPGGSEPRSGVSNANNHPDYRNTVSYVELVGPASGEYCLRICRLWTEGLEDACSNAQDTAGCHVVVPGDYSATGFDTTDKRANAAGSRSTSTAAAADTTTTAAAAAESAAPATATAAATTTDAAATTSAAAVTDDASATAATAAATVASSASSAASGLSGAVAPTPGTTPSSPVVLQGSSAMGGPAEAAHYGLYAALVVASGMLLLL